MLGVQADVRKLPRSLLKKEKLCPKGKSKKVKRNNAKSNYNKSKREASNEL